jgi:hypothetical protein
MEAQRFLSDRKNGGEKPPSVCWKDATVAELIA